MLWTLERGTAPQGSFPDLTCAIISTVEYWKFNVGWAGSAEWGFGHAID
jgi:hypothetical protein